MQKKKAIKEHQQHSLNLFHDYDRGFNYYGKMYERKNKDIDMQKTIVKCKLLCK